MGSKSILTLITLAAVPWLFLFCRPQLPVGHYVKASPNSTHAKISNLYSRLMLIAKRGHATSAVS